jgi:predicted GNAT superfamily acetyltransferase
MRRMADDELVTRAAASRAAEAAEAAGIAVREVHDLVDLAAVRRLFDTLWSADPTNPVATVELLRAYTHTGQYVVLADDLTRAGRPPVAASVGFLAAPAGRALHSNVTGVLPPGRGRSLGHALKLHQRAWALERGLAEITWTFDPLIRRNAWFNLAKLGATVRDYLVDFYGAMADGVNAGDASDRLYLSWRLASVGVAEASLGRPLAIDLAEVRAAGAAEVLTVDDVGGPRLQPRPPDARHVLAQVPPDIESLRSADPARAREWRLALREVLGGSLADGWCVRGVTAGGFYVLERDEPIPEES